MYLFCYLYDIAKHLVDGLILEEIMQQENISMLYSMINNVDIALGLELLPRMVIMK